MPLTPLQKQSLATIWRIGANRGLTPQQQREMGAVAMAESGLNPQAVNKSSGAAGLFQLLSSGYRSAAEKYGGLFDPRANTLAIINSYVDYWKKYPNAAPGAAGRDVERSGMGTEFYARPLAGVSQYYAEWGSDPNMTKEIADYTTHADELEKQYQNAGSGPRLSAQQESNIESMASRAMPYAQPLQPAGGSLGELTAATSMPLQTGPTKAHQLAVAQFAQRMKDKALAAMPQPTPPPAGTTPAATGQPDLRVAGTAFPKGVASQFSTVDAEGAPDASGTGHHAAYDWMLGPDKGVPALLGGTVIEAKPSRGSSGQVYGGTVKIQTASGQVLVFRHVNPNVKVGQKVVPGQAVATVTRWNDNPSSSHAHTELWKTREGGYTYGNMLDPVTVFGGKK